MSWATRRTGQRPSPRVLGQPAARFKPAHGPPPRSPIRPTTAPRPPIQQQHAIRPAALQLHRQPISRRGDPGNPCPRRLVQQRSHRRRRRPSAAESARAITTSSTVVPTTISTAIAMVTTFRIRMPLPIRRFPASRNRVIRRHHARPRAAGRLVHHRRGRRGARPAARSLSRRCHRHAVPLPRQVADRTGPASPRRPGAHRTGGPGPARRHLRLDLPPAAARHASAAGTSRSPSCTRTPT